jgi:hypothetical protein
MAPPSLTDCGQGVLICNSGVGYDGPSGVGTPNGINAFKPSRQRKGGGPEAPLTEECAGTTFTATGKVCGTLNPNSNTKAGYYFAYNKGVNCTGGKETPLQAEQQGEHSHVSGELYGLEAGVQYSYCLVATDTSGETTGQTLTITTEPAAPKPPQTSPATNITTDAATLEGKLGPQPIATSWYFQYAPQFTCTSEHTSSTADQQDTTPSEVDEVSAAVAGLQPGTVYNICLVASNKVGFTVGSETWFMTKPLAPSIEHVTAQSTKTEATLEGTVNPNAQQATCEFVYGTSESYGSSVPCEKGLGNEGEQVLAIAHIANLAPGVMYRYQLRVQNEIGGSSPSEGKGTVTTQAMSIPGEPSGKETPSTPPAGTPIVTTLTPVGIPTTPITTPTTPSTGGVALAGAAIAVQGGRTAVMRLECLGSAGCRGKLTLSAKIASKARGRKKPARTVRIGIVSFSIPGDETKTVRIRLDAAGRVLLAADHARLSATLTILELVSSRENIERKVVQLVEEGAHDKTET